MKRKFFLALFLLLTVAVYSNWETLCWATTSDASEDPAHIIKQVSAIEHNGQRYEVIELLQDRREKISKWNIARGRRGERYVLLAVRGNNYPIRLSYKDFAKHKKELKGILDRRKYEDAHPFWFAMQEHERHWGGIYNKILGVALTGIQGVAL